MHLSLNNSLGKWILPKEPAPFSPEATNYFSRLDAAGDTTYVDYKQPLANYIDSLVSLGGAYWDTMESSTSFVGVGIQGVTVPLKDGMPVPTNNNFVAGDLDQLTGLKGDGSTKYLGTNTIGTDYAQNDTSVSVFVSEVSTGVKWLAGTGTATNSLYVRDVETGARVGINGPAQNRGSTRPLGLVGGSRTGATAWTARVNQVDYAETDTSQATTSEILTIFATGGTQLTDARLATYHAGPALDLATLEGLQATLLSEIRTAHTFVAAASYFSRLVAAGDTTHVAYKQPLTNYITSLVELGGAYWDTMKSAASFVGVGIQGITVPLRDGMTVPTNNNFVAGDLDQLTGLKGDASTKYLGTGVLDNDVGQNDYSISVWVTDNVVLANAYWIGSPPLAQRSSSVDGVVLFSAQNNSSAAVNISPDLVDGFIGQTRTVGTDFDWFINTNSGNSVKASIAPIGQAISVFAYGAGLNKNASRIATYHIGPALNLATLEGLQDTLITEIAAI